MKKRKLEEEKMAHMKEEIACMKKNGTQKKYAKKVKNPNF